MIFNIPSDEEEVQNCLKIAVFLGKKLVALIAHQYVVDSNREDKMMIGKKLRYRLRV